MLHILDHGFGHTKLQTATGIDSFGMCIHDARLRSTSSSGVRGLASGFLKLTEGMATCFVTWNFPCLGIRKLR
jgi:hypothetical protein